MNLKSRQRHSISPNTFCANLIRFACTIFRKYIRPFLREPIPVQNTSPTEPPDPSRDRSAWLSHLALLALLLYFAYVYSGILFMTEGVTERDGFYHARYSQMLPQRGLSRELPWMQFTDWKEHFCDKDFLYHVYLAPFTRNAAEPLPGAKWGTLLLFLGALAALYFVLRKWKVPFAVLWVALMGVGSAYFLTRMFMVRSHCLSVLLMILATHVILKRRFWPCFAMAFLYAWSYSVPLAMLITACVAEAGRFIAEKFRGPQTSPLPCGRGSYRFALMPLATAAGLLAGLAIHPYSPYSLKSLWMFVEIARSGALGSDVELGSEFRHATGAAAFSVSIGTSIAALAAVNGALMLKFHAIKFRTLAPETAAVVALSTAWFISMFVSFERFIEYAAPMACLACGFVARDMLGPLPPLGKLAEKARIVALSAVGLFVMVLAGLHSFTYHVTLVHFIDHTLPAYPKSATISKEEKEARQKEWLHGRFFDGAGDWMRAHLPPGTVVANFYWDDFPELFYGTPEMHYLVGLDPTFMRLSYPEKSKALEDMRVKETPGGALARGKTPLDFGRIKALFGSRYTILRRYRAEKYVELLDENRRLNPAAAHGKIVYQDALTVIYEVEE